MIKTLYSYAWCDDVEGLGSYCVQYSLILVNDFHFLSLPLLASLTRSLSYLTHAQDDVLLIINRGGHIRGRGRLWAEIQLLKVVSLISIFDSFCLSDSRKWCFMLRILGPEAGPEGLDLRYYWLKLLRRGYPRSGLRWSSECKRRTGRVSHLGLSAWLLGERCLVAMTHLCCFRCCLASRVWTP